MRRWLCAALVAAVCATSWSVSTLQAAERSPFQLLGNAAVVDGSSSVAAVPVRWGCGSRGYGYRSYYGGYSRPYYGGSYYRPSYGGYGYSPYYGGYYRSGIGVGFGFY